MSVSIELLDTATSRSAFAFEVSITYYLARSAQKWAERSLGVVCELVNLLLVLLVLQYMSTSTPVASERIRQ
jgi:hypothetical protein